jgi:predicted AlkP superfamily phosphohydrolase/phosphomutase
VRRRDRRTVSSKYGEPTMTASGLSQTGGRPRVLVLGLDSATPQLVFDAWRDDLPTLSALMQRGIHGRLESTIPAITVPAWSTMTTGLDPGQLGFYGFRNRANHTYEDMTIANARDVRHPRLWDRLGDAGMRVAAIGVPQTFPVRPVNGELVSCFLTPSSKSEFTHPSELKAQIHDWLDGDEFLVDVPAFRSEDKHRILRDIYRMTDQHFTVCRRLLERQEYDFFMMVEMGVDRIQHAFWQYMDPDHPKHVPGSEFAPAIHDYYVHVDRQVASLLELVPDDTVVLVVSDHGARTMDGGVCINEWLIERGYLALAEYPSDVRSLERCQIDWPRTRAWASGGYYGRVFMNVQGREPQGVIPPERYEAERDALITDLATITDPGGRPIGVRGMKPEDLYASVTNVAPDLIVYFGDLEWRSVGSVGFRTTWTFENDTGPDEANHAQHGIFIMVDPRQPAAERRLDDLSIYDVTPTVLSILGQPIPDGLRGKVIAT